MSKYARLAEYLANQDAEIVPMTFEQFEQITGAPLPASAAYRSWWSNNSANSVQTKTWLRAGFRSEQVDMKARRLVFRRVGEPRAMPPITPPRARLSVVHPAYGAMKGLVRIVAGTDLAQPVDRDWTPRHWSEQGQEKKAG